MILLEEMLQQCTVKITVPGGWGTGFFVAPGLILTCAHVVRKAVDLQVTVFNPAWQQPLSAIVKAQADDRKTLDLALVKFSESLPDHPCVLLDEEPVAIGQALYSYGYLESYANAAPVHLVNEGLTGNTPPLLKLQGAQIEKGISGAALLNLKTGKVCGMIKETRTAGFDLGGGAIPTRVILEQFPELRELQQQAHQQDLRWAKLLPETTSEPSQIVCGDVIAGDKVGGDKIGTQINNYYSQETGNPTSNKPSSLSEIDFKSYLRSLIDSYERWWDIYHLTEVISARQATFTFEQIAQTEEQSKEDPTKKETVLLPRLLQGIIDYAESEPVLLVGSPGVGKSTTLLRLLAVLANQELQKSAPRIPVLIRLKGYQPSPPGSEDTSGILALIKEALEPELSLEISEVKTLLFQNKRLFLLLDGLNEIPADVVRSKLTNFRDQCKRAKIPLILTTRNLGDNFGIQRRVDLQPLSPKEIQRFLSECMPGQEQQVLQLLNKGNQELGKTPFVLWMLYDVSKNLGQVPKSLGEAFSRFTKNYTTYKINQEGIPYSPEMLQKWSSSLEYLAFEMLKSPDPQDPGLIISERRAANVLTQFPSKNAIDLVQAQALLNNLLKYHLLQKSHKDEVSFCHQLIQEYYAAEYLLQQLPDLLKDENRFKQHYLNCLKWTEPVALMLALVDSETQAVRVVEQALDVDHRLGARLAGEVKQEFQENTVGLITSLRVHIVQKLHRKFWFFPFNRYIETPQDVELPKWLWIELLEETRSKYAIPALLNLAEEPDQYLYFSPTIRIVNAIGKIRSAEAVQALLKFVEDPHSNVRCDAVVALGSIGSESVIPILINLVQDFNHDVRRRAAEALGNIGSERAIPTLLKLVKGEYYHFVRCSAAEALGRIGSDKAIPALLKLAKDEYGYFRPYAIEALSMIASEKLNQTLLKLANNPKSYTRRSVAKVLGKIGSKDAISALLSLIEDSDTYVRCDAAEALGEINSERVIQALLGLIEDPEFRVRREAAKALGKNGSDKAIPALLKLVEDSNLYVRCSAAKALGKNGSDKAIPALLKLVEDSNLDVRRNAAVEDVYLNIENVYLNMRCSVAEALGKIGIDSETVISVLLELVEDSDDSVRCSAISALGSLGSEKALPTLLKLARNKDRTATQALGSFGSEEAISTLLELLSDYNFSAYNSAVSPLCEVAKRHTDSIAQHLPYLLTYLLTNSGENAYEVILAIQENCKYYNYEIFQAHLAAQKADRPASQNSDRPVTYKVNAEVVQIVENNYGTIHGKQTP